MKTIAGHILVTNDGQPFYGFGGRRLTVYLDADSADISAAVQSRDYPTLAPIRPAPVVVTHGRIEGRAEEEKEEEEEGDNGG